MSAPGIEQRLPGLLREAPVPGATEAERRGHAVVAAAFAERGEADRLPVSAEAPRGRPASLPRLALGLLIAALAAALLLSPAGASVRHWVGDVFTDNAPKAHPGLTAIPGGGRLLVQSADGPWVVQADGSRRLLGDYSEATWSPHGLFVGTASGRTLNAVEPDGTPHWTLNAPGPVTDPRWWAGKYRIAYRAGNELRVVAGDGSGDHLLARGTAPVAPVWSPTGLRQLAFVEGGVSRPPRLTFADAESGAPLDSAAALPSTFKIEWADPVHGLLEVSRSVLRIRALQLGENGAIAIQGSTRLPSPGGRIEDASVAPAGDRVAVVARLGHGERTRSSVLLYEGDAGPRRLLTLPGRLSQVVFSPDSRRLLVAWPDADEWLFVPVGKGQPQAVGDVSAAFAPGSKGAVAFPTVEGWCCAR
ncbi:MAG TPA: hypothetical protein VMT37_07820 [Solirubrobacterales bacterium]|nr:hypothetical protein [Solirubrobacterales bacterium]